MWRLLHKNNKSPFRSIIVGFLLVILMGSFLLMLPVSTKAGVCTPFLDALFTSTSAVCVTGLVIYDTATYWSNFGQSVIILLIQIGGLGVVTVAGAFVILSGKKIGLAAQYYAGSNRGAQCGRDRTADRVYFKDGSGCGTAGGGAALPGVFP